MDRGQLERDGYTVARGALSPGLVEVTEAALRHRFASQQKPLETVAVDPAEIPFYHGACAWLLSGLGFDFCEPWGAYAINKKPFEGRRPWHRDWQWWHLPISFEPAPAQVGCLLFFCDTSVVNGCLRVLPGSQLAWCDPLDVDGAAPYVGHPGEVPIELGRGDVLLLDPRTLHASHANLTGLDRPAVNLWLNVREFPTEAIDHDHRVLKARRHAHRFH